MLPRHATTAVVALALMATAGATTPAVLGPPWISIEYPVNPYDRDARDAYLVVHTFHHQVPTGLPVSGRAEGLVSGVRRTVALSFGTTSRSSDYTLRQQWPQEGSWVLVIESKQGEGEFNRVTALVDIGRDGRVSGVRVPTVRNREGYQVPAAVTTADVDAALARVSQPVGTRGTGGRLISTV